MRVLVLNPNTSPAMTAHVAAQLQAAMPAGAQLLPWTARQGPPVVADAASFAQGGQSALEGLRQARSEGPGFDAVLLACFGDPALEELRLQGGRPVVGLAQASMQRCERDGLPYAVVTAGPAWQALLEKRFAQWGASALWRGVQVLQGSGLDVLGDPLGVLPAVREAIVRARALGARQVVLGGAVFAGYPGLLRAAGHADAGLVDCVACAAQALQDLA